MPPDARPSEDGGSPPPDSGRVSRPTEPLSSGPRVERLTEQQAKLARTLIAAGPLTKEEVVAELAAEGKQASSLGRALLASGYPTEFQVLASLLHRYRLPRLNVANVRIPQEVRDLVPASMARRLRIVPVDRIGAILVIALVDIHSPRIVEDLRRATGLKIALIHCDEEGIARALARYYPEAPAVAGRAPRVAATRLVPALARSGRGPMVLRALVAEETPPSETRLLDGHHIDVRARWERLYTAAGPVPAQEAPM